MRLVGADFVAGALDIAQDALGAVEQFLAGLGQPDAAIGAGEQGSVELVLEPLHLPGQRRLCDLQMRRGAGDAAEFGDADEVVEAAQFHGGGDSAHPRTARSIGIVVRDAWNRGTLCAPRRIGQVTADHAAGHEHDRQSVFA